MANGLNTNIPNQDVIMPWFPGIGRANIEADPNQAFEQFLLRYNLPPDMMTLARGLLPKILNQYFLRGNQIISGPKRTPTPATNGVVKGEIIEPSSYQDIPTFTDYLNQQGIRNIILPLLGQLSQIRPVFQPTRRGMF